jgi:hypothetical protein
VIRKISLSEIKGKISLGEIKGKISLGEIKGKISLGEIKGKMSLSEIKGNISLGEIKGRYFQYQRTDSYTENYHYLFNRCSLVSSTNKTDRHHIAEILLKVALNTITH